MCRFRDPSVGLTAQESRDLDVVHAAVGQAFHIVRDPFTGQEELVIDPPPVGGAKDIWWTEVVRSVHDYHRREFQELFDWILHIISTGEWKDTVHAKELSEQNSTI